MPPQGLLLIAAYMPEHWPVRFIDENIARATQKISPGPTSVFVSGMHIQAAQIHDIASGAKAAGKVTALGGPSVSSVPEMYPDYDYLHIGELGDSTDRLIAQLDEELRAAAGAGPLRDQGTAAADRFSDPGLSPRAAAALFDVHAAILLRLSLSLRVLRHPQSLRPAAALQNAATDHRRTRRHYFADRPSAQVYFVDDNFIGNRKAAREMLPHWSNGRSSAAIRCNLPARRRSTSPSRRKFS